ncbi:Protocatechuate 4,5-dioxygenase beta chain [Pigmentiphaga humi]|uniref:Protocatechuate 4,5-dioxygenase beta chain n=1 Tax=Pigmentiphaga humi TaxID=2478468 RepID=A0A3P4AYF6_9BURK|nr:protocatechuate 3,4-dioxygenase [Pigmentiphaga humi]VCU68812.1 Protocatechuate 4,5-dioxygenase beta chain [Pigmentiphaga humi]
MAKIVLGIGTSHGPMLSTPPEQWGQRVEADKANSRLFFRGKTHTFDQLAELRKSEGLAGRVSTEMWREQHAACQAAIKELAKVFADARPDVAVIAGNDQMELFTAANIPTFAVYCGETILNYDRKPDPARAPGIDVALRGRVPEGGAEYRCETGLARHLLKSSMLEGFDVAALKEFPADVRTIPHAYGFVYRQIMSDKVVPSVPVFTNAFYPPNQPTANRCRQFGRVIAHAIESWDNDLRVAVIASGGLSHFVIDEEIDRVVLDGVLSGNLDGVEDLPESIFQSGTSEIKNWIPVMGTMSELGMAGTVVDYIPCYRSEAGTGNAMGFVYWTGDR